MNSFDFTLPFQVDFNLISGLSSTAVSTKRMLSDMRGMFCDDDAYEKALAEGDRLVYEFYELGCPEESGQLAFGTSITYPGTVGNEYYMTKGHFHTVLATAEVYYCLSGEGYMMMENPEGGRKDRKTHSRKCAVCSGALCPSKHKHRKLSACHFLCLPRRCRPQLRNDRNERIPEADRLQKRQAGSGRKPEVARQPGLKR